MSLPEAIGGYFGLEPASHAGVGFLHDDAILLNTARNCFEYILQANKATHVYMPKFTCDVMMEPLQKLNIPYTYYNIDENLEIAQKIELKDGEYLVYTNYFGIKDSYSHQLSDTYGDRLILDCSQAYYFEPLTVGHTIYSPRKFFGLPDGGCVYTPKVLERTFPTDDSSHERMSHLLKRIEIGAEEGYADFQVNDASLIGQPMKQMSELTRELLAKIDFKLVKQKRLQNFQTLHAVLETKNEMTINTKSITSPMVYPFRTKDLQLRKRLIDQKIFVATYWPNVLEWSGEQDLEYSLTKEIIPLPIDQRYGKDEMEIIIGIINGSQN